MKQKQWIILDYLADVVLENVLGCIVEIGIGYSTETLFLNIQVN